MASDEDGRPLGHAAVTSRQSFRASAWASRPRRVNLANANEFDNGKGNAFPSAEKPERGQESTWHQTLKSLLTGAVEAFI
jgi:hypothetical protein